ncbi:MAG: hypothetical protein U0575_02190 [Phycisphaerales bacterium]
MPVTPLLAAVHVSPSVTVPSAAVAGVALGWLWWWEGRAGVPRSRRAIRRFSFILGLMLVPTIVSGLSFVDPSVDPRRYAQTWSLALLLLAAVVGAAVLDAMNSFRLHAAEQAAESSAAADALATSAPRGCRCREPQPRGSSRRRARRRKDRRRAADRTAAVEDRSPPERAEER